MKTITISEKSIERKWHLIDAKEQILGRLASKTAQLLIGKHKSSYSPHLDTGDFVVVINAKEVKLTGNKPLDKTYFTHTNQPGNSKIHSYEEMLAKDPAFPVVHAIRGMLPKNARGRKIFKKLHVYAEGSHPHTAQNPEPVSL